MANNCGYNMKVVGDSEANVNEFCQILSYQHPDDRYFSRIFEAYVYRTEHINNQYIAYISGDCAWSVYSCMCAGPFTYYTDRDIDNLSVTNLALETKRLHLVVEIYSEEPGVGFAEHIIYDNGEEIEMEERDFSEYWLDDFESAEEFEDEYDLTLTPQQKEHLLKEGYITIGGYDEVFTI